MSDPLHFALPTATVVDGVKINSERLHDLDRIARGHRATQAGFADRIADLRAEKQDAQRRLQFLTARVGGDPRLNPAISPDAAQIDGQLAAVAAAITETEAELTSAAEAAGAARQNLKAAIALARDTGLAIPAGLAGEGRASA